MGDELRWQFRRKDNDIDSSSDDSKSSLEAAHGKHKLLSCLISDENDEETGPVRVERNGMSNSCSEDKIMSGKGKRFHPRRRGKASSSGDGTLRASHEAGSRKKSKSSVYDPAAIDELKRFMESLLDDLKKTRENLFSWMKCEMQKLVVDDTLPPLERSDGSSGEKTVLMQYGENFESTNSKENEQVNNKRQFEDNILIQHQNKAREDVLVQRETNMEDTIHAGHHNSVKEIIQVQNQNNFEEASEQVQYQNKFQSGTRSQTCNVGALEGATRSNQAAVYENYYRVIGQQVNNGEASKTLTPGERLSSSLKPNFQSCFTDDNVQMQHQMNYQLGVRPENYTSRYMESILRGRERVISDNFYPLMEHQVDCVQDVGAFASSETQRGATLGLPVDSSISNVSSQVESSMYLTSPSVLTRPYGKNHMPDTSSYNYLQQSAAGNRLGMNNEKANQMLKVNAHHGSFSAMNQQELNGSIPHIGSRNVGYFDSQSIFSSSTGTSFPVEPHQGMSFGVSFPSQASNKYIPQDEKNTRGLRMNEGARMFLGGSCAVPEHYVSNNFCSQSVSKPQGTLEAFQKENLEEGTLFPK